MIYDLPNVELPISQGDIIDGCPLFRQLAAEEAVDLEERPAGWLSRVIVLTQACDLAQAKTSKVLVAVVHDAAELVQKEVLKASVVRDQVRRGLVYGWYFLPAASAPLKVGHTVPRAYGPAFHRHLRAHRSAGAVRVHLTSRRYGVSD